ncbi:MAG: phosphoglycerate kinase [Nitrososphaeria archaeon]|nr:phosphoglycerate kinase [Nitrososphaeria archaeon]
MKYKTLDDVNVKSKTVIVRVDFNSTVDPETKKLLDDERIKLHSVTVKELASKGAKVIVLAHQGRPGDPDFISLEQHARRLEEVLNKKVKFVADVIGERALEAVKSLEAGEILLLDNVRSLPDEMVKKSIEEHSRSAIVKALAPLADLFVIDAFAAAHRAHASIVGFIPVLPTVFGRVMEKEVSAIEKIRSVENRPIVYVLGGSKVREGVEISEYILLNDRVDHILTGGLVAQLFLYAKGISLGEANVRVLNERGLLDMVPKAKSLLERFPEKIFVPEDLAVKFDGSRRELSVKELPTEYEISDIGSRTMENYSRILSKAKAVFLHGPMGVYEESKFIEGTWTVFRAAVESGAFTVAGGGHTIAALSRLGLYDKVSYVSSGGGALLEAIMGRKLPVIEAMEKYQN